MSRREPKENETPSDNVVALLNQVLSNRYWFLPLQYTVDALPPVDQAAQPYRWKFRFPDWIQQESARNSIFQIELVQYSIVRSGASSNRPIFLFIDFNGDMLQTPYMSVINSASTDGISLPMQLQDKLSGREFSVYLTYDRNRSILATADNITDLIFTFKYSIRSI